MNDQFAQTLIDLQQHLRSKSWDHVKTYLDTILQSICSTMSTSTSTHQVMSALEFMRSVVDTLISTIDVDAGTNGLSRGDAYESCVYLMDANVVEFGTAILRTCMYDGRIVARISTMFRLLCQAAGARELIGAEGISALTTTWRSHLHCIPIIHALVTLTPSHVDNISRVMRHGGIITALHILTSRIHQYQNNIEKEHMFHDQIIELVTRLLAICVMCAPDDNLCEKHALLLIPTLKMIGRLAVQSKDRQVVTNVLAAFANIADCHVKDGFGYALTNVPSLVNAVMDMWHAFRRDETVATTGAWALSSLITVNERALASACEQERKIEGLTKNWKGYATMDYLREKTRTGRYDSHNNKSTRYCNTKSMEKKTSNDAAIIHTSQQSTTVTEKEIEQQNEKNNNHGQEMLNTHSNQISSSEIITASAMIETPLHPQSSDHIISAQTEVDDVIPTPTTLTSEPRPARSSKRIAARRSMGQRVEWWKCTASSLSLTASPEDHDHAVHPQPTIINNEVQPLDADETKQDNHIVVDVDDDDEVTTTRQTRRSPRIANLLAPDTPEDCDLQVVSITRSEENRVPTSTLSFLEDEDTRGSLEDHDEEEENHVDEMREKGNNDMKRGMGRMKELSEWMEQLNSVGSSSSSGRRSIETKGKAYGTKRRGSAMMVWNEMANHHHTKQRRLA